MRPDPVKDPLFLGLSECFRIFATDLRSMLNCRAASLLLIPPTWHAKRTRSQKPLPKSLCLEVILSAQPCGLMLCESQNTRQFFADRFISGGHIVRQWRKHPGP